MDPGRQRWALPRRRLLLASMLVLALVAVVGFLLWRGADQQGQDMTIPDSTPSSNPRSLPPATSSGAQQYESPFVTAVSDDGRHFVDQAGQPLLLTGDAPWSLFVDLSPAEARRYLDTRAEQAFNAMIVSLIGAEANGGPSDDGATYDGVVPFVEGDILDWNPDYWQRVHDYLEMAASRGITAFLYPIDGWTIGNAFSPSSEGSCEEFGARVAQYFADLPNIVWVMGGDYFPAADDLAEGSDVDHCMDNALRGIRSTGDTRPFSIQLGYDKSVSTENPFWAARVDWNFVYTYHPTYAAVLEAYRAADKPALFSEGNYEGENNQPETPPTTDETLRRQALWALTSGSPGEFYGSQDWRFEDGWQRRLESSGTRQLKGIRDFFRTLPWWRLEPDDQRPVVTGGRGRPAAPDEPMDVMESDYVTAASTPDGGTTVVYIPTGRTFQLDVDRLPIPATAVWFDPSSGRTSPATVTSSMTTPGPNSSGDGDWLLVIRSSGRASPTR